MGWSITLADIIAYPQQRWIQLREPALMGRSIPASNDFETQHDGRRTSRSLLLEESMVEGMGVACGDSQLLHFGVQRVYSVLIPERRNFLICGRKERSRRSWR